MLIIFQNLIDLRIYFKYYTVIMFDRKTFSTIISFIRIIKYILYISVYIYIEDFEKKLIFFIQ